MSHSRLMWMWVLSLGAGLGFVAPVYAHTGIVQDTVRVHILELERPTSARIWAKNGPLFIYTHRQQKLIGGVKANEQVSVESWVPDLQVRWHRGGAQISRAEFRVPPGALLHIELDGPNGREVRAYRGWLEILVNPSDHAGTLRLINHVHLEDYVAGVIPSEYDFPDLEGVKAQAVAIRTYAIRSARNNRNESYHLSDHEASQKYEGALKETGISRHAARSTQGQVLLHRGQLIEAVYSSSCGGHTANNEDVWRSRPVPYLRGRPDPYETLSPHREWNSKVAKNWLLTHLSRRYKTTVTGIQIGKRGKDGRLKSVVLETKSGRSKTISAASFRNLVNRKFGPKVIRSANFGFTLNKKRDQYLFKGHGYGHGVGLCQWGTAAQAKAGRSYQKILSFYYKDTELREMSVEPKMVAVTLAVPPETRRPKSYPSEPISPPLPPPLHPSQYADDVADTKIRGISSNTRLSPYAEVPRIPRPAVAHEVESVRPPKVKKRRVGW